MNSSRKQNWKSFGSTKHDQSCYSQSSDS